jgi:peptidoglycan DL-endopeptidase CwlO
VKKNRYSRACVAIACVVILSLYGASCSPTGMQTRTTRSTHGYDYRSDPSLSAKRKHIIDMALSLIGSPYRMGGAGPRAFDCSGFSMYVFKKNGVKLPRTATTQYVRGHRVPMNDAKAGDLIFFNISGRGISHVGIYIGGGEFVHAPSTGKNVRIDRIDSPYWKGRVRGVAQYTR